MPLSPDEFGDIVATAIKMATAPLLARIAVLETQAAQGPRDGRDGLPGVPGAKGDTGPKGLDGAPGRDGTLEQLLPEYDGERTLRLRRKDTGESLGVMHLPMVLDRGVYQAERAYEAGDGVSWAGSFWIAQRATSEKPGDGDTGWRLAVKRGSEGKPGPKGDAGARGPKGES